MIEAARVRIQRTLFMYILVNIKSSFGSFKIADGFACPSHKATSRSSTSVVYVIESIMPKLLASRLYFFAQVLEGWRVNVQREHF